MSEREEDKGASLKFFILGTFIVITAVAAHLLEVDKRLFDLELRSWIEALGFWGPVVYILLYAAAPTFMAPGLPITVLGGVLFGPLMGTIYASLGATIGASIAFLVARHMGRDWVRTKLKSPRLMELDRRVEKSGWKVVAFTRLIPLFPFNVLNYAFGLTAIGFKAYLVSSFIFMIPGVTAYVLFSSSIFEIFTEGGTISNEFIVGALLIVTLSLIPIIYKIRKDRSKDSRD